MFSLLKEAGIKSHYTVVKAGENANNIITGFSTSQFNHVIVCVPMSNDTIWLECTNQKIPFGYIGTFTDNRDVLIIDENSGKIVKTKKYSPEQNIKSTKATFYIDSLSNTTADILIDYTGLQYDNASYFFYLTTDEQKKYLYSSISIPDFIITKYKITYDQKLISTISQEIKISSKNYATNSGKRIFIPLNTLNKISETPVKPEVRKNNIVIKRSYIISDTIEYILPENFEIEYLTNNILITSDFGEYSVIIKNENSIVKYIRTLKINEGIWTPEKYSDFTDFYKQIVKADNEKMVLKK